MKKAIRKCRKVKVNLYLALKIKKKMFLRSIQSEVTIREILNLRDQFNILNIVHYQKQERTIDDKLKLIKIRIRWLKVSAVLQQIGFLESSMDMVWTVILHQITPLNLSLKEYNRIKCLKHKIYHSLEEQLKVMQTLKTSIH